MKRTSLMIFALFLALVASAQSVIRVQAPNMVSAEEQFNVSFIIDGEHSPSSFSWTPGDSFQLVWGPQKGSSSSISIVNGKRTSRSQVSYTYVLMPKSSGKFTLPQAQATVKGNTITSETFQIEVVGGGNTSAQDERQNQETARESGAVSSDIFMKLILSKSRVVVGEPVTATLKLYQRTNVAGFENAKFPSFNGFWSEETEAPTNIEFHRENVGGQIFNAAVLRRWTLVPQQAGDIQIEPAELVCLVNVRNPSASTGSIFDSFFQDEYQTIRKRLSTPTLAVRVNSLPSGAPASFSGAVGQFRMNASLSVDSLRTHDAASLAVTITGKGNVALLEAPAISFPPDFEVYDVKTESVPGGKRFEYPFIPRSHGKFSVGPVEFSYYDISAGKYVTLSSGLMDIDVAKGKDDSSYSGQAVAAPAGQKNIRSVGNDIRFIETDLPAFSESGDFFAGSLRFWMLFAVMCIGAALVWFGFRKASARRADVAGSKSRTANKMARKRLATAGVYLEKNLYSAFYEELHKTLLGYVSDKLNMDMADMSKDNISSKLSEAGVPLQACDEFVSLLDSCEFARYSPASGQEAMSAHYESAVNVISSIDGTIKGQKKSATRLASLSILLLLVFPLHGNAADAVADSLWNAGVSAYAEGDFTAAISAWEGIISKGLESDVLYFNLGNAYFKSQETAKAILSYERSLRLNPSCDDARFNLEFVKSTTVDRVESVPEFFLKTWFRKVSRLLSSDGWAAVFFISLSLFLVCLLLLLLAAGSAVRRTAFYTGTVLLVAVILSISLSFSQKAAYESADSAVITSGVCSVKSSPGDSSIDLFVLHEGTEVKILDSVGEWVNIEIADGRQGWIRSSDNEVI